MAGVARMTPRRTLVRSAASWATGRAIVGTTPPTSRPPKARARAPALAKERRLTTTRSRTPPRSGGGTAGRRAIFPRIADRRRARPPRSTTSGARSLHRQPLHQRPRFRGEGRRHHGCRHWQRRGPLGHSRRPLEVAPGETGQRDRQLAPLSDGPPVTDKGYQNIAGVVDGVVRALKMCVAKVQKPLVCA